MAGPNEIQVGRFNRFVQKFLGIKGTPPMPSVSSDLQLTYEFESAVDTAYLEGWDTFLMYNSIAPAAGQLTNAGLRNPAGSNCVAVIEVVGWINSAAADSVVLNLYRGATLDNVVVRQGLSLDARSRPRSTCIPSDNGAGNAGGIGGTVHPYTARTLVAASGFSNLLQWGEQIPLLPGDAIQLASGLVTVSNSYQIRWRERFLEQDERQ